MVEVCRNVLLRFLQTYAVRILRVDSVLRYEKSGAELIPPDAKTSP